jgi:hypothetical protein
MVKTHTPATYSCYSILLLVVLAVACRKAVLQLRMWQ